MEELPKAYDPKETEDRIYSLWEKSGAFKPKIEPGKSPFTIVIPPPNVTGSLHMGHALNNTIQDILIRRSRMRGVSTLWLPGTDHAGIATQNVVEKKLAKEGKNRNDLGREEFVKEIEKWVDEYGHIIIDQLKKIGCSCDWSRQRFTMDEDYQEAVKTAFQHYHDKGWIYQADRVINWCPRCQTALSDIEVEYKEQAGKLYYFKYDKDFPITIATTRPETKLGDTAVAVNPDDKRYQGYIGKTFDVKFAGAERNIKIIADPAIDQKFGTGAVGVTPAHSLADSEMAGENNLQSIIVIDKYGKMTEDAGEFQGLKAAEAREKVLEWLKKENLLEKEEDIVNNLSVCYRCGREIEPQPSKQWFLKMSELIKPATEAVKNDEIKITPNRWKKVYLDWMENIRDWCISRQIWWGHKIPIEGETDVLDTWFSSALWPFATLGWPNTNTIDLTVIRHGEAEHNIKDICNGDPSIVYHLTEKGKKQIEEAADKILNKKFDAIYISEFNRASESMEIIKKKLGLDIPIIKDQRLNDIFWSNLEGKDCNQSLKATRNLTISTNGSETAKEAFSRTQNFLIDLTKKKHKNVLIITHEPIIQTISKAIAGESYDRYMDDSKIVNGFLMESHFSNNDLEYFYPTSVLSTARDINMLWVVRMIFSGFEFMKKKPFSDVYIHPTIFNKEGKRMSKSLGTGIDPLELVDKYGADATRFGLTYINTGTQDIKFDENAILAGKKFANKLWNISRFVLIQLGNFKPEDSKPETKTEADKKILARLEEITRSYNENLDNFRFGQAAHDIYGFIWHDLADIYVEESKKQNDDNTKQILFFVLRNSLILLHPIMPFLTEEIWQKLAQNGLAEEKYLITTAWPQKR